MPPRTSWSGGQPAGVRALLLHTVCSDAHAPQYPQGGENRLQGLWSLLYHVGRQDGTQPHRLGTGLQGSVSAEPSHPQI